MKGFSYGCERCNKVYGFNEGDNEFFCPKCRKPLTYRCTEEIDPATNKVVKSYVEAERQLRNPSRYASVAPVVVECPYCHSKNTRKISGFAKLGTLSWGATPKEWHCNRCDSDF